MLKKFMLETTESLHLIWKIQSALKGFSMKDYIIFALQRQIEKDKDDLGKPTQSSEVTDESHKTDS